MEPNLRTPRPRFLAAFCVTVALLSQFCGLVTGADSSLAKLKELVKPLKYDDWVKEDWVLQGFLDSKRGNVNAARLGVEEMVKYRIDSRIDGIENEIIDLQLSPPYHISVAKDLSPVLMWGPARWDIRRIILSGGRDKLNRYIDKMYEAFYSRLRKVNAEHKNVTQVIQILDLTNYNLRQHACVSCFALYVEWLAKYENYLPGRQSFWAFINTPQIFKPLLNILKNAMSPPTKKALQVYESDKGQFTPVLLNLVDADKLPKAWGGTKDDFLN